MASVLGKKIMALREAAGLSQSKLAERIGVSRQTVYNWECGATVPEGESLIKLSAALGVDISSLISDDATASSSENESAHSPEIVIIKETPKDNMLMTVAVILTTALFILGTAACIYTGVYTFSSEYEGASVLAFASNETVFYLFLSLTILMLILDPIWITLYIKRKKGVF